MFGWGKRKAKEVFDYKFYVIDDEELIRENLAEILEELYKCQVLQFPDVDVAISLLKEEVVCPDLILSDVRMPGSSGFSLPAKLREIGFSIPVVFVTGLGGKEINDGKTVVISKPYSKTSIKKYVDQSLESAK